jgi:hypothetical protein
VRPSVPASGEESCTIFNPNIGRDQEPREAYSHLDPEQTPRIAAEFIRHLEHVPDPVARGFARRDPRRVSRDDLADMHQYVEKRHPQVLSKVLQHPLFSAALGGFAARYWRGYQQQCHDEQQGPASRRDSEPGSDGQ